MVIRFNHTIVAATDPARSARLFADLLGRPALVRSGPFEAVEIDNGVSLDFVASGRLNHLQHYAFLVEQADFNVVISRIRAPGVPFWADPWQLRAG